VHDLVALVELLELYIGPLPQLRDPASGLTVFAVGPRYPHYSGDQTPEDAADAMRHVDTIFEFVEGRFESKAQ
jgi:hypothetical protein